jgi:hypothetical protein
MGVGVETVAPLNVALIEGTKTTNECDTATATVSIARLSRLQS